jgi:2-polyprenyl-3-methyl-5-hydroxy-6-metoxy-1,4-benzoquinol methylase
MGGLARRTAQPGSRDRQRFHWVMLEAGRAHFPGAAALEVGPDDGTFADGLDALGYSVTCVDNKPGRGAVVLDVCRGRLDRVFDLIHCGQVLEHVVDDRAALANIRAMCGPRTLLLASAPDFPDPEHLRTYSRDSFVELLCGAGFRVLREASFFGRGRTCFGAVCQIREDG